MQLAQQDRMAIEIDQRRHLTARALIVVTLIVAVAAVAILAASFSLAPTSHAAAATSVDPLTQPAAIDFRQSEHASGVSR